MVGEGTLDRERLPRTFDCIQMRGERVCSGRKEKKLVAY